MRKLLVIGLLTMLTACGEPAQTPPGERIDNQPKPVATNDSTAGTLCVGCVGPHINLMSGRLELFSIGPGISLF